MLLHSGGAFASPDAVKAAAQAALARQAQASSKEPAAAAARGAPAAAGPLQTPAPQPGHSSSQPLQPAAAGGKGRKRLADTSG